MARMLGLVTSLLQEKFIVILILSARPNGLLYWANVVHGNTMLT